MSYTDPYVSEIRVLDKRLKGVEARPAVLRAADCVGASIAGVDVLPGQDGVHYVLEVNAVPGWKALVRTLDVDVGAAVVDHVVRLVEERN